MTTKYRSRIIMLVLMLISSGIVITALIVGQNMKAAEQYFLGPGINYYAILVDDKGDMTVDYERVSQSPLLKGYQNLLEVYNRSIFKDDDGTVAVIYERKRKRNLLELFFTHSLLVVIIKSQSDIQVLT